MATFALSTPRAPNASRVSPSPAATPRYAAAGIVVTETATPTPELALVSSASIPATPAASATTIVSLLTLVRLPSTVESMLKLDGMRSNAFCANADAAAAPLANVIPIASVAKARPARRRRRSTRPTPTAVIGRRSGLIAIAPTIRITLYSITP